MIARPPRGLLDTSVFIATERARPLAADRLPSLVAVSVVTIAELRAGVLVATGAEERDRRLRTLDEAERFQLMSIDDEVARQWAVLRVRLAEQRRRVPVNDLWIAATALAHGLPVVTQDADFDPLDGIRRLQVIRV